MQNNNKNITQNLEMHLTPTDLNKNNAVVNMGSNLNSNFFSEYNSHWGATCGVLMIQPTPIYLVNAQPRPEAAVREILQRQIIAHRNDSTVIHRGCRSFPLLAKLTIRRVLQPVTNIPGY